MIYNVLIDYGNQGDLFRLAIESEDLHSTLRTLLNYSNDVRYIDSKDELGKKDKGNKVLEDGSIIRRSQFFGSKIGYQMRFQTSEYKTNILNKAVDAREVLANEC